MKNKKNGVLVLGLLIAVAVLGIGYAALTGSLQITGSANATKDNSNFIVQFTGTPTGTKENACTDCSTTTLEIDATDKTKASLSITGFKKVGDSYSGTFTVSNNSLDDLTAYVKATASMSGTNASYFTIVTDWADVEQTIAKDGSKTIKVTVTLSKAYTGSEDTISADLTVSLSASTESSGS